MKAVYKLKRRWRGCSEKVLGNEHETRGGVSRTQGSAVQATMYMHSSSPERDANQKEAREEQEPERISFALRGAET